MQPEQISRTAFRDTGHDTCPYCKGDRSEEILGTAERMPFENVYKKTPFRLLECPDCRAVFSLYGTKGANWGYLVFP
jgi:hypothetical protein